MKSAKKKITKKELKTLKGGTLPGAVRVPADPFSQCIDTLLGADGEYTPVN